MSAADWRHHVSTIFNKIDKNNDGSISRTELILALRRDPDVDKLMNLPSNIRQEGESRKQFEAMFQALDLDASDAVSFSEFTRFFSRERKASLMARAQQKQKQKQKQKTGVDVTPQPDMAAQAKTQAPQPGAAAQAKPQAKAHAKAQAKGLSPSQPAAQAKAAAVAAAAAAAQTQPAASDVSGAAKQRTPAVPRTRPQDAPMSEEPAKPKANTGLAAGAQPAASADKAATDADAIDDIEEMELEDADLDDSVDLRASAVGRAADAYEQRAKAQSDSQDEEPAARAGGRSSAKVDDSIGSLVDDLEDSHGVRSSIETAELNETLDSSTASIPTLAGDS
eukprot:g5319.t1